MLPHLACALLHLAADADSELLSMRELRAELSRAQTTLASVRALLPRVSGSWAAAVDKLKASKAPQILTGYQGYMYIGMSYAPSKLVPVQLWGTSATTPRISNLTLVAPIDKFALEVVAVSADSFSLKVNRTDQRAGWGQQLLATYFVEGVFATVRRPTGDPVAGPAPGLALGSAATALRGEGPGAGASRGEGEWIAPLAEAQEAQRRMARLLNDYFSSSPPGLALPAAPGSDELYSTRSTAVARGVPGLSPLLRHLGGNWAGVDNLWHQLITGHPEPSRATVIEVGVAEGEEAMVAADSGMRVIAVSPIIYIYTA